MVLGLGLLSIGRAWGLQTTPPPRTAAVELIEEAYGNGIRFFDTAPAYNTSEAILGEVLANNPDIALNSYIATKAGEHWINHLEQTYVDHTFDALCRSIDRSLELLGRIDLLQLHKASVTAVKLSDVERAISYAKDLGVGDIGASVSSESAATAAIDTGLFGWLQFPLNRQTPLWSDVVSEMAESGMRGIVNRPFAMGASVVENGEVSRSEAFRYVLESGLPPGSVVLTGTSSKDHLNQNINSYRKIAE